MARPSQVVFSALRAAWQAQPEEARGMAGALQTLREQPYGPWLLGITGLGLIAFAVYSFVEAGYRRVPAVGVKQN